MVNTCDSARSTPVGHRRLRLRQHWRNAIRISDVEQHAFRHDACHFPRGEVHHEERLPSDEVMHTRALLFQARKYGANVIAEADRELHELPGLRDTDDVPNRADADIQFLEVLNRYDGLDRRWRHWLSDRASRDVTTIVRCWIWSR